MLRAPLDEATLDEMCDRVRVLVEGGVRPVVCDAGGLAESDLRTVAVLARLQLTARRCGASIRIRNASPELHGLLWLAGLCRIVGPCVPLGLEARRQAEEREEPLGIQEERDAGDPIA